MTNMKKTALLTVVILLLCATPLLACSGCGNSIEMEIKAMDNALKNDAEWIVMDNGLSYKIITVGTGEVAESGNTVTVHYTGTFEDGRVFDSSVTRNQPFVFQLGAGRVIQGWDLGVAGMKVGEKRILRIPSNLAYGTRGAGDAIPPNTDLVFEIELLSVR